MNNFKRIVILFGVAIVFSCMLAAQQSDRQSMMLSRPSADATILNNMPELSWTHINGCSYELWIDDIRMASDLKENWFIPFPLSYGTHNWKVVASKDGEDISNGSSSFTISGAVLAPVPENAVLLREDWRVKSSILAGNNGAALSKKKGKGEDWKLTSLPATVLSVMVRNGLYPNPYLATNNMLIPDLSDEFNEKFDLLQYSHIPGENPWQAPYWYQNSFELPADYKGKMIWLTIGEINYRAKVWLNGQLLGDTSQVVGMERMFRFEISDVAKLKGNNTLAIAIYPPDHPGIPADPPLTPLAPPGLNMANGMISKDYTRWDVIGWDWIPAVRDRDMGITEEVYIHASDPLEINNLYVTSDLPLPSTAFADVSISTDLLNHAEKTLEGTLKATISGKDRIIELEQDFLLAAGDTLKFLWDPSNTTQLRIKNPKLWWPVGYGDPDLYDIQIEAISTDYKAETEMKFGIREVETYIGSNERVYKVNGKEIYCKGGNWVLDMMLNWTADRYEKEILMSKHANLNMLRVWGPTGAPPEVFYEMADKHGILLWQDFLNDFWGTFKNTPGMSPDEDLFEKASIELVKRYRNHPSLIIWCGGNEGPNPREELLLTKVLPIYDGRDSKHYLKISNGDGLHGGGPYHTILPEAYFSEPKLSGFSSEIGPSGVPEFESVKRFMPNAGENWKPGRFPLDGVWAYHDAINFSGSDKRKFSHYDDIIRSSYGAPDSTYAGIENYLDKCQLLNHDVYRACLEAVNSQLWENSSGLLLWKSNSSWPSMVWQVYDWYLQAHAGFYGTKKSAAPLSVQFNRKSHKIEVINASLLSPGQTRISAMLYNEYLEKTWVDTAYIHVKENAVYELDKSVPITRELSFLKLELLTPEGDLLADNFYWLNEDNDFTSFNSLPGPVMEIEAKQIAGEEGYTAYTLNLFNSDESIALMTNLKLVDPLSGLELLPAFWSDNYLSLLPGEKKTVEVRISTDNLPDKISLSWKAFNMKQAKFINLK